MHYMGAILLCKAIQPLLNKKCSALITDTGGFLICIAVRQLAAAVLALLFVGELSQLFIGGATLLLGVVFAVCLFACTFAGIMVLRKGTIVLASLAEMSGLLIPSAASIFLFGETIQWLQLVGLVGCLISAWLLSGASKEIYGALPWKTIGLLFLCFVSNGGIMMAQKLFSEYVQQGNNGVFHVYGFLISALMSAAAYPIVRKRKNETAKVKPLTMLYGVVLSAAMLAISMLSTAASGSVPAVVLFSVVNGGGLMISAVVSAVVYKEKMTVRSAFALGLGLASLMIINFA